MKVEQEDFLEFGSISSGSARFRYMLTEQAQDRDALPKPILIKQESTFGGAIQMLQLQ